MLKIQQKEKEKDKAKQVKKKVKKIGKKWKNKRMLCQEDIEKKAPKGKNICYSLPIKFKQSEALTLIMFGNGMKQKDSVFMKKKPSAAP